MINTNNSTKQINTLKPILSYDNLKETIYSSPSFPVIIKGPKGSGKSTLIYSFIHEQSHNSFWIDLKYYNKLSCNLYDLITKALVNIFPKNQIIKNLYRNNYSISEPIQLLNECLLSLPLIVNTTYIVIDEVNNLDDLKQLETLFSIISRFPENLILILIFDSNNINKEMEKLLKNYDLTITESSLILEANEIKAFFENSGEKIQTLEAQEIKNFANGYISDISNLFIDDLQSKKLNRNLADYLEKTQFFKLDYSQKKMLFIASHMKVIDLTLLSNYCDIKDFSFVFKKNIDTYIYTYTYKDKLITLTYLCKRAIKKCCDLYSKEDIYTEFTSFYIDNKDFKNALFYWIKCNDSINDDLLIDKVLNNMNFLISHNNFYELELLVKSNKFSNILTSNPVLSIFSSWYYFISGDSKKFNYYSNILFNNINKVLINHPRFLFILIFIVNLDLRLKTEEIESLICKFSNIDWEKHISKALIILISTILNMNLKDKRIINSIEILLNLYKDYSNLKTSIQKQFEAIELIITNSNLYDQNSIQKSLYFSSKCTALLTLDFEEPLKYFIIKTHLKNLKYFNNKKKLLSKTKTFKKSIAVEYGNIFNDINKSLNLEESIEKNDVIAVKNFIDAYSLTESNEFSLYKLTEHFILLKAYILIRNTRKINIYFKAIENLCREFKLEIFLSKIFLLKSIYFFKANNIYETIKNIKKATLLMYYNNFTNIINNDLKSVIHILKILIAKCKLDKYYKRSYSIFILILLNICYTEANKSKVMSVRDTNNSMRLSKQQTLMVTYLKADYSINEAAKISGLSANTIKSHLQTLYKKLNVKSKKEALKKVSDLNLI